MKDSIKKQFWEEKYRPDSLGLFVFPTERMEEDVEKWKDEGRFPNLILSGSQGTGKSSFAGILINEFDIDPMDTLILNGSIENRVQEVRDRITQFVSTEPMSAFKVVLFEEGHRLTRDAQEALYDIMEKARHVSFIFTTNYPNKLSMPLQSRCSHYAFGEFNEEQVLDYLAWIVDEERISIETEEDEAIFFQHVEKNKPDIRAIVRSIQNSVSKDGKLKEPSSHNVSGSDGVEQWEKIWTSQDNDNLYKQSLELVDQADDHNIERMFEVMYENIHQFPDKEKAVINISRYLERSLSGGFQPIHLEAFLHHVFLDFE